MKQLLSLLTLLLLTVSCEHRPLVDLEDAAILKVRLVTSDINNITCNIYNEQIARPSITSDMMRVFVYDESGTPLLSQGFVKEKTIDESGYEVLSGPVTISPGHYRILSYNFDVESTYIKDEYSYHTVHAYTDEIPSNLYNRFGRSADSLGPVYYEPEHLMVAREPRLVIEPHQDIKTIELDAHTVIDTYYIQIRISGVENMAANAAGLAVLSGLAPSTFIGETINDSQEPGAIYFEMQRSTDSRIAEENQHVLCAVFNTFGKIQEAPSNLKITMTVLTRTGETHQKEVDMTPIFQTEDARLRHWLLIDEVWDIPDAAGDDGGGFTPKVDAWEDIEETIPIGPNK